MFLSSKTRTISVDNHLEGVLEAPQICGGGVEHYYQSVQGWFVEGDIAFYKTLLSMIPDGGVFVEVGSWRGRSFSYMLVEALNTNRQIKMVSVDHFGGSPEEHIFFGADSGEVRNCFLSNASRSGYPYELIEAPSLVAAERFQDESVDAVFIDAAHNEQDATADFAAWLPKVKVGGVLSGHDSHFPGVQAAWANNGLQPIIVGDTEAGGSCWYLIK